MKKLFDSGELGPAERTILARFYLIGIFFGRRGRENQRQLTPTILSLRKTIQIYEDLCILS